MTHSPTSSPSESPNGAAGKLATGFDLDHRNVALLVSADYFCIILLAVRQCDCKLLRPVDDMIISQNRAVGVDDESRTDTALALRPARCPPAEESLPKLLRRIVTTEGSGRVPLRAANCSGRNIDHRRSQLLCQVYEVR